ncbi:MULTISPECIES: helix-turn-helix domain-containing protein [unclassified Kitasatospora]|uniref:helix-turn-helix domain-containing protein n=1 Tax=unclassified Kitasatospora TaxID=2633591 RepID=UPI002475CD1C|nr:helix-turn-helix transcriptional regulator [Kitasatospora sp. MAP12-44]
MKLRLELRALREAANMTASQVAKTVKWSTAKMTRMETGDGWVQPTDVEALCRLYDAGPELTELLSSYALVTKTHRDQWKSKEYQSIIPPGFSAYLGLEGAAAQVRSYESEYVPGLLQTETYMRELLRHARRPQDEVDRLVKIRLDRQTILKRESGPTQLAVVINESVLRRVMGSPDLMRDQLNHLADVASTPNIKLQIVPFAAGFHPAMTGAFTMLTFEDPKVGPLIHLEALSSTTVIDDRERVRRYEESWADLIATAASRDESVRIVTQAAKEL